MGIRTAKAMRRSFNDGVTLGLILGSVATAIAMIMIT